MEPKVYQCVYEIRRELTKIIKRGVLKAKQQIIFLLIKIIFLLSFSLVHGVLCEK